VVIAMEIVEVRVEEVEDEVTCEHVVIGVGEAGLDQGSGPHHQVEIRLLTRWERGKGIVGLHGT
jgi:hypothetical protein